jgi:hypothetical protein
MKKIGTDISIAECRRSGYMVMEFSPDLIKNGKLDKDVGCTFSVSNPNAWTDSGTPDISKFDTEPLWDLSPHDTEYSWNDLMEFIKDTKKYIMVEKCCDWGKCIPNFDNPTEYDMLHMASDIHFTLGIYV